ncbi:hypothetical protein [Micromonospora rubida]|uniref:hypothetical protein n=1 Tax=Micromonospora rubida TaxID=2697657 RepID=UPI0013787421|nr:hypothetical protein [Micromonospora rubida]NBE80106.1 hypothetical protein [Micromonospora rubida]
MADEEKPPLQDVTPPDVTMHGEGWPKQITGELSGATESEGDPNAPVPVVPEFSVVLSPFFDAQNAVMAPLMDAVMSYEALKNMTNERKDWVFAQAHAGDLGETKDRSTAWSRNWGGGSGGKRITRDPELVKVAPEMRAALDNGLLAIADTLYLVGEYVGMLNTVPQVYTNADKKSFVPTE